MVQNFIFRNSPLYCSYLLIMHQSHEPLHLMSVTLANHLCTYRIPTLYVITHQVIRILISTESLIRTAGGGEGEKGGEGVYLLYVSNS